MAVRGDLARRIIEKTNRRRSPLYLWLHMNYADIAKVMSRPRPSWTALAETATEAGQVDDAGKKPNANSVRAAWLRVCRDLGKPYSTRRQTEDRQVPADVPPTSPSRTEVKTLSPSPDGQDSPDEPPTRHTFRPAKIR